MFANFSFSSVLIISSSLVLPPLLFTPFPSLYLVSAGVFCAFCRFQAEIIYLSCKCRDTNHLICHKSSRLLQTFIAAPLALYCNHNHRLLNTMNIIHNDVNDYYGVFK